MMLRIFRNFVAQTLVYPFLDSEVTDFGNSGVFF